MVLIAVASSRERGGDAVFSFNPRVDAMPERLRSIFWVRHLDRITMLTLLGLAILAPFVFTQASQHVVYAAIAAFTICALSLTVLTGWAGQLSLGQMAFAGIGAFTGAALTRGLEIDWFFYISLRTDAVRASRSSSPRSSSPRWRRSSVPGRCASPGCCSR